MTKKIKYVGEKRKHLSTIYKIRNAVLLGLNEDNPEKYNNFLEKLRKEINALEMA